MPDRTILERDPFRIDDKGARKARQRVRLNPCKDCKVARAINNRIALSEAAISQSYLPFSSTRYRNIRSFSGAVAVMGSKYFNVTGTDIASDTNGWEKGTSATGSTWAASVGSGATPERPSKILDEGPFEVVERQFWRLASMSSENSHNSTVAPR